MMKWKVAEIKSSTGEKMPTIGRPKALGDIRGVTYIYAIFFRFGLIEVPDNVKEKMEGNTSSELILYISISYIIFYG